MKGAQTFQSVNDLLDFSAGHCALRSSSGTTLHWPARYVALYFQWLTLPAPGSGCVLKFCVNGQVADCQFAGGQLAVSQEFVRFVSCPLRSSSYTALAG